MVLTYWLFNFEAEQGMKTAESEFSIWSFFLNNWHDQVGGKDALNEFCRVSFCGASSFEVTLDFLDLMLRTKTTL